MTTPDATMSDQYPPTVDIEIDRERLKNYLCAKWLAGWMFPIVFLGTFITFGGLMPALERGVARSEVWLLVAKYIGIGLGLSSLLALLLYLIFSRRLAIRYANSLKITVEGAFLRIYQHTTMLTDRKLHFRAIVDYATTQDFLMRYFGIHALQMTTTGGGLGSTITIPGIKDCLNVRDTLSDIDRLRENQ